MKILIAGSFRDDLERQILEPIIRDLIKFIPINYEIILGSDRNQTVDYLYIKNIELNKCHKITIFYHERKDKPFKERKEILDNKKINFKKLPGEWSSARVLQVQYSDVIILIGGDNKTKDIIHIAEALDKKVVPLNLIPGAAYNYWSTFSIANKKQKEHLNNIENWEGKKSVKSIIDIFDTHIEIISGTKKKYTDSILLSLFTSISIFLWGWLFFGKSYSVLHLYFITFISSLLGVYLYGVIKIISDKKIDTYETFIYRPIATCIISFLILLLYFGGALSINGNLSVIDLKNINENFQRLALSVSIISFFGGLLTEKSIPIFEKIILKVFNNG